MPSALTASAVVGPMQATIADATEVGSTRRKKFFAVDGRQSVAPLPAFISDRDPAKFEPITQFEHIEQAMVTAEQNRLDMQSSAREARTALEAVAEGFSPG